MAAEKWMVYTKRADFQKIADEFGISPVTARIMRNRDVEGEEAVRRYLFGGIGDLYDRRSGRNLRHIHRLAGNIQAACHTEDIYPEQPLPNIHTEYQHFPDSSL